MSSRTEHAVLYLISGSGLAIANTIGLDPIDFNIFSLTIFPCESPIKTSAPKKASSRVFMSRSVENSDFSLLKFFLSFLITPLLSVMTIFFLLAPKAS